MATINAVGNGLSGSSGTELFVGSNSPVLSGTVAVSDTTYSTGTAGQPGDNSVVVTGGVFTPSMVGGKIVFSNGIEDIIIDYISASSLSVSQDRLIAPSIPYTIYLPGVSMNDQSGYLGVQNIVFSAGADCGITTGSVNSGDSPNFSITGNLNIGSGEGGGLSFIGGQSGSGKGGTVSLIGGQSGVGDGGDLLIETGNYGSGNPGNTTINVADCTLNTSSGNITVVGLNAVSSANNLIAINGSNSVGTLTYIQGQSWTPTNVSGDSFSLVSPSGSYNQIGKTITFRCKFTMPASPGTANVEIAGLPVMPDGNNTYTASVLINPGTGGFASPVMAILVNELSSGGFRLYNAISGAALINNDLSNAEMQFSMSYNTV